MKVQGNTFAFSNTIRGWTSLLLVTAFFIVLMACVIVTFDNLLTPLSADPPVIQNPQPSGNGQVSQVKVSPLDEPIQLLSKAQQTYTRVKDYTCTLVKQEQVGGKVQPEHVIEMKFRQQPFSVYMKWNGPRAMNGQEVSFVAGRNDNMMRVRSPGILRAVGFVSIHPRDPRAVEQSRHTIVEAGIGNLIARCLNDWQKERNMNRTQVRVADYMFNKRPCTRLEIVQTEVDPKSYCYRTVMYLDKQTTLPVRIECYDWPQQGGPAGGELLEVYSYVNMRFNTGLTDSDFPG